MEASPEYDGCGSNSQCFGGLRGPAHDLLNGYAIREGGFRILGWTYTGEIVDLVREVGAARTHDAVGAGFHRQRIGDFGIGVRAGENDRGVDVLVTTWAYFGKPADIKMVVSA